jgi:hypothetical protein
MKKFLAFITEAKDKTEVLLFGRMNPITSGHEENVLNAHNIATKHGGSLRIVGSHSHDAEKNPLSPEQKKTHMQRAFGHLPNTTISTSSKEQPTILHHAAAAHASGASHLVIAGGSDRAEEYKNLLNKYNGVQSKHGFYNFKSISVENTGARKAGVSGTDMRKHAAEGNYNQFKAGLPSKLKGNAVHAKQIYNMSGKE